MTLSGRSIQAPNARSKGAFGAAAQSPVSHTFLKEKCERPAIGCRLRDVRNSSYHGCHKARRSTVGSPLRGPAIARLNL